MTQLPRIVQIYAALGTYLLIGLSPVLLLVLTLTWKLKKPRLGEVAVLLWAGIVGLWLDLISPGTVPARTALAGFVVGLMLTLSSLGYLCFRGRFFRYFLGIALGSFVVVYGIASTWQSIRDGGLVALPGILFFSLIPGIAAPIGAIIFLNFRSEDVSAK